MFTIRSLSLLTSILLLLVVFNQLQIASLHHLIDDSMAAEDSGAAAVGVPAQPAAQNDTLAAIARQVLPTGVPPVYGAELGVSFDDAAAAISVLAPLEQDTRPVKLTGDKLSRYISIGQRTSCQFCCGATTLVFPDGRKACACAHSAAMRGVIAYLLDSYGDQITDDRILLEANKWKAAFFPGPTVQSFAASLGTPAPSPVAAPRTAVAPAGLPAQVGGC